MTDAETCESSHSNWYTHASGRRMCRVCARDRRRAARAAMTVATRADTKTCLGCGRLLELDEFYTDRGLRISRCMTCKRLQVARYEAQQRQKRETAA